MDFFLELVFDMSKISDSDSLDELKQGAPGISSRTQDTATFEKHTIEKTKATLVCNQESSLDLESAYLSIPRVSLHVKNLKNSALV